MLLFADSHDHYNTAQILRKWGNFSNIGGFSGINAAAGRNGTAGYRQTSNGSDGLSRPVPSNPTRLVTGFGMKLNSLPATTFTPFVLGESGIIHAYFNVRADGRIEAFRGGGISLGASSVSVSTSQYNYIEADVNISDGAGIFHVRVNEITFFNLTGVDTRNGGAGVITTQFLGGAGTNIPGGFTSTSTNGDFDDFYTLDTLGSTNNTFLGDVRVQAILPNGAGNYTQWTPTPAVPNWQNVDENPATDDTDYNSSSTTSQKDSFTFADITPTTGTVFAVAHNLMMRKDDAGVRTMRALARLSATDAFGSNINVGTSYANYQTIFETKPGGGQYTIADVNNSEFGYDLVA